MHSLVFVLGNDMVRLPSNRPCRTDHIPMTKITFIQPDGSEAVIAANVGQTVMEAAKLHDVPGIDAECGGACACATCHVYIDGDWLDKTGTATPTEEGMLDFAFDIRPESRLSCQIRVVDSLDGLIVRIPAKQF